MRLHKKGVSWTLVHHHFHPEANFFYENATGTGDVIKIWREGTHKSKKGKFKNANIMLQRVKMSNFWGNTLETPKSLQILPGC